MAQHEVFDELLNDFREGYARYGNTWFLIIGLTFEEHERATMKEGAAAYLGSVPLSPYPCETGFFLYGRISGYHAGTRDSTPAEEAFRLFHGLASRAGGHLPLEIRQQIPFEPVGPIGWWLAFMWHLGNPPAEKDLLPPDGVSRKCRVIWVDPFLDSATAIETFGLNLPDNVKFKEPKGSNGNDVVVTVKRIAEMVHLEEKSMGPHKKNWPKPFVSQSGTRPAKYKWEEIRPVLVDKFPGITIPVQP